MDRLTTKLFACRYMHLAITDDIVVWANQMLELGYSTDNLVILAALPLPAHWQEVDLYFHKVLRELGYSEPGKDEALRQYAGDIASDIISGSISAKEGFHEIQEVVRTLDDPGDLAVWLYMDEPDIGFGDTSLDATIMRYAKEYLTLSD